MLNLHPLFVHFPIALLTSAFALELLGLILKNDRVCYVAAWNLLLGAVGAAAAVVTGVFAEGSMQAGDAAAALAHTHRVLSLVAFGMAAPLAAWRLWSGDTMSRPQRLVFLALMLGMVVVLALGAHTGGRLVYEYGAGASLQGAAYD